MAITKELKPIGDMLPTICEFRWIVQKLMEPIKITA